jgi:hypothetical protein
VPSPDLLAFAACLRPKTTAVWRWAGWRNNINLWKVQSVLSVTHVKRKKRIWKNLMKTNRHHPQFQQLQGFLTPSARGFALLN